LAQSCRQARGSKVVSNLRYTGHQIFRHGSRASGEKRRRAKQAAAALGGTVSFTSSGGASDAVTRLIKRIVQNAGLINRLGPL